MKVFGAKNGTTIKPVVGMAVAQLELDENGEAKRDAEGNYIVACDYSDFDGAYDTPKYAEGPDVRVSAKPGFNVNLNRFQQNGTAGVYDFSKGNDDAIDKEAGQVFGRACRFGINVSMMNDEKEKGLKGLELPDGSDISFELDMEAAFGTDDADPPLLWCVYNTGGRDQYGRGLAGNYSSVTLAPKDLRKGKDTPFEERQGSSAHMWNGGDWTFERQSNGKLKVTISNYVVNPLWFPTGYNLSNNSSKNYFMTGGDVKYLSNGVFSARNINIIVPFGSNITDGDGNPRPDGADVEYATNADDPNYYLNLYGHDGNIKIKIKDTKLDVKSQSGQESLVFYPDEKEGQVIYSEKDDMLEANIALARGGGLDSRKVYFGYNGNDNARDVNNQEYANTNGKDAIMPGSKVRISGGITYTQRDTYETAWISAAQVLIKFDDEHLTPQEGLKEGELFAAKPNGKGWDSDDEMKSTGIDQLVYYSSREELLNSGDVCVGVLKEYRNTGNPNSDVSSQTFSVHYHDLLVTEDSKYYNTVSMTSMCTRLWRIDAYKKIIDLNGEFPSYTDSGMQGKTVEEYIVEKHNNLSAEDKAAVSPFRDDVGSKSNLGYVKSSYDEDGFHKGSGTEATWGDSLYIIPYKMGINKIVEQRNGPDSNKPVPYSFERGETIADFCLSPYFTMPKDDIEVEIPGAKTKVTVSDVLPKGLEYMSGSAYIGGTYQNNTNEQGGHGEVIGGTSVEPIIEEQEDGTTILKWELENVDIGDNDFIPAIHFSANIDQEIVEHTSWLNTGRVRSTEDNREYDTRNGNLDTASIEAAPSGNFIIKKIAKHRFNDHDQDLEWTLRWRNTTSQTYTKRVLIDVLPYNGDPRGTEFTGSYNITKLNYKFLNGLNASNFSFYYTTDPEARTASAFANGIDYDGLVGDNPTVGGIEWHKAEIADDGTVSAVVGKDIAAFLVAGDVPSQGEVRATVTIKPEGNKPGDHYVNAIAVNDMMQGNRVDIIKRGLRGTVWREDEDSVDGSRQLNELKLGNVKVVLKKQNSAGEWEEFATTATEMSGRYEFSDLPAGKFRVEFVNSGGITLSNYLATTQNAEGVAASHNSDARPLYQDEVFAVIEDIEMPAAVDMNTSSYYVEHQDLGVWRPDLTVSKTVRAPADVIENLKNKEFSFKLTVPGGEEDEIFEMFNADKESVGPVTGAQLKKGYIFKLKHGESIRFAELPANVEYTLEEQNYSSKGYTMSLADESDAMSANLDQNREVNVINTYIPPTDVEIGNATFYVRKVDNRGNVITSSPAIFELFKENSNESITAETSTENGLAKFVVEEAGRYTLKEKQAPKGYKKTSDVYTIIVEDAGRVFVEEDTDNNENIFERLFNISGDGDWDADTLTLTVANEKLNGNLSISKQVDKNVVREGDTLVYTLLITNISDVAYENGNIWDVLPEQIAYLSDDSNGVYSLENGRERIDWTIDRLEPGETKAIHMNTLVKECSSREEIVNFAYVKDEIVEEEYEDTSTTKVLGEYADDTEVMDTPEKDGRSNASVKGPSTGDTNAIMLVAMIFAVSFSAYVIMAVKRRKTRM